jgi:hypothetical protein
MKFGSQVDGWIDAASIALTPRDLDEIAATIRETGAGAGPAQPTAADQKQEVAR